MLTIKQHSDGNSYHAQEIDGGLEFILDEDGDLIPSSACLCYAHEWSECCCGCDSWGDDYDDYDYDYNDHND